LDRSLKLQKKCFLESFHKEKKSFFAFLFMRKEISVEEKITIYYKSKEGFPVNVLLYKI